MYNMRRYRPWLAACIGLTFVTMLGLAQSQPQDPVDDAGGADMDDESRQRLIRKTQGDEADDVMGQILQRMQEAQQRLVQMLDPGEQTQGLQQKILEDLDLAIKQAQQNLRMKQAPQPSKSDPRDEGQAPDAEDMSAEAAGDPARGQAGEDEVEAIKPGELRERQRQWGNLPPRDRREMMQRADDESNPKYEEQIERYYEALAEPED